MREIKFRVWDKESKEFLIRKRTPISDTYVWTYQLKDGSGGENTLEWCMEKPEGFNVMQYTGLKDKNEKEIYEGDIVKVYDEEIQEVDFYEGRFFPLVDIEYGYNAIDEYRPENYEVIGNIYENPELLIKKDNE